MQGRVRLQRRQKIVHLSKTQQKLNELMLRDLPAYRKVRPPSGGRPRTERCRHRALRVRDCQSYLSSCRRGAWMANAETEAQAMV